MFVDVLQMDYRPQSTVPPGLLSIDKICRQLQQS